MFPFVLPPRQIGSLWSKVTDGGLSSCSATTTAADVVLMAHTAVRGEDPQLKPVCDRPRENGCQNTSFSGRPFSGRGASP